MSIIQTSVISMLYCRHECGVSKATQSIQDSDKESVISSLCLHFVLLASKAELDETVHGLKSLDVLSLVKSNPIISRQLFV